MTIIFGFVFFLCKLHTILKDERLSLEYNQTESFSLKQLSQRYYFHFKYIPNFIYLKIPQVTR